MLVSPNKYAILKALRSVLLVILPSGVEIVQAQANRAAEPKVSDFVVMQEPTFERLATNLDDSMDVKFTGSIDGITLTVTNIAYGVIENGATVFGVDVAPGTKITGGGPNDDGTWTYTISGYDQTVASEEMSSGAKNARQNSMATVQLDIHGPNGADNAQVISTLLRDEFGVEQFAIADPTGGISPLFADDPKQIPFINDSQQYEDRWVVECRLQVNQTVSVPQQYADGIDVRLISVEASFPG